MKNYYYYATALTVTIGANLVESRWIDYEHWTVPDDPKIHIFRSWQARKGWLSHYMRIKIDATFGKYWIRIQSGDFGIYRMTYPNRIRF